MQAQRLIPTALISLLGLAACSPSSNETGAVPASAVIANEAPPASAPIAAPTISAPTPAAPAAAQPTQPAAPAKPIPASKPVAAPKAVAPTPAAPLPASAPIAKPVEPTPPVPPRSNTLTQEQAIALATRSNCMVCHRIEGRLAGPAWKAVGDKYQNNANAAAVIAANIRQGGRFGWNMGNMPAKGGNSSLSDTDITNLAGFIATLR